MAKRNSVLIWYGVGLVTLYLVFSSSNAGAASSVMVSDAQLQQTANYENFSATAYPDGADSNGNQLYSIGYGHQIKAGESYLLTATIDQATAQQLLLTDMQAVVNALINSGVNFTTGQFDALSDFGYNAGIGAMNKVIATFVSSGSDAAASEIMNYVYWHPVPGGPAVLNQSLVSRRTNEINTWNS
jgi:GH24 family phage-related lysozyme (muramidase)